MPKKEKERQQQPPKRTVYEEARAFFEGPIYTLPFKSIAFLIGILLYLLYYVCRAYLRLLLRILLWLLAHSPTLSRWYKTKCVPIIEYVERKFLRRLEFVFPVPTQLFSFLCNALNSVMNVFFSLFSLLWRKLIRPIGPFVYSYLLLPLFRVLGWTYTLTHKLHKVIFPLLAQYILLPAYFTFEYVGPGLYRTGTSAVRMAWKGVRVMKPALHLARSLIKGVLMPIYTCVTWPFDALSSAFVAGMNAVGRLLWTRGEE